MNTPDDSYVKNIVEAILFISEKPVTLEQMKEVLGSAGTAEIRKIIGELMQDYETGRRGMIITEIAGGYQMLSSPQLATYVRNFFKKHVKEKLSRPGLEALAIMAYKQPVTRGDIELIRGVNSDGVMSLLLNKGLIKVVGRKDIPGRPYLYGTTKLFLEYFGLKSLQDLPRLEEFPGLIVQTDDETTLLHPNRPMPEEPEREAPSDAEERPLAADDGVSDAGTMEAQPTAEVPEEEALPVEPVLSRGAGDGVLENSSPAVADAGQTAVEDVVELKQAMDQLNREDREHPARVGEGEEEDVPSPVDS